MSTTTATSDETRREFRNAMAHLSAAVNVLTTSDDDGPRGITVSAVCSVTDEPPTVLVCVNRSSSSHEALRNSERVGVNVLSGDHTDVARHFAGMTKLPMDERFASHAWEFQDGVPLLSDAVVTLAGRVRHVTEQGTHSVMFVEVEDVRVRPENGGLVYFDRQFHRLGSPAPEVAS
ncbi:flavin reductase [Kineococcus sp. SYSU DK001]|uniref:flavin reductase n=1 Tax=Kineococcus sp. SYSU DK001 TaxID=3383122 RepID=UPI003D7C7778